MAKIISASRRTDIPRFYGEWFQRRREAGTAEFRNAFGFAGSASLRREDVLGFLFWTKLAAPFSPQLDALEGEGVPVAFQYTLNGYGAPLEPNIPALEELVADFRRLGARLPSPACLQWRYDPILISGHHDVAAHLSRFEAIAGALEGSALVVNTSIVEPYLKAIRRVDDLTVRFRELDPARHKAASRRYPELGRAGDEARELLEALAERAREHGFELRACANPEWGLPPARCCGVELFSPYGQAVSAAVGALDKAPTRSACQCLASVDIGMDNTCVGGCRYCYVVSSQEVAARNHAAHDPLGPSLR